MKAGEFVVALPYRDLIEGTLAQKLLPCSCDCEGRDDGRDATGN